MAHNTLFNNGFVWNFPGMGIANQSQSITEMPIMRDLLTLLEDRPLAVPAREAMSAIEFRFPHIARELCTLWKTNQIELYLDSLLIDNRGDRVGFPADVMDELMFLSGLRWHLCHQSGHVEDYQTPDVFSFSALNQADLRKAGNTRAWILE